MRFVALLVLTGAAAFPQHTGEVLLRHTFEEDTNGWLPLGGAKLQATNHALALSYEARPKQLAAAVLPASPVFARMGRIRFRARADYDTAVGVVLSEHEPGGRYVAWFWAPANAWQEIELTPADFIVSDGPNDPVDADGRLDLDSLQGLGIFDLAQFFGGAAKDPDFPVVVREPSGAHTIQIDDFELWSGTRPSFPAGVIDRFDRGFLQWVTLGGMDLQLSVDNPLGTRALRARYAQDEAQFELLLRRLTNLDLSKATRLAFDVASEHEATLVISLESKQGARHNMTIYPPGGRERFHVDLKLADFEGPGKLDPRQLKTIAITDITAAAGGAPASNTIWISKVETASN